MGRDVRIEAFRCLCMFGVCLLHALDQGGYAGNHRGLDNLCNPSVVGFLFISGYFGINLTFKRVLKLVGIGAYCAAVVAIGCGRYWDGWRFFQNGWFLWCYLALMLLSPILNSPFSAPPSEENRRRVTNMVFPALMLVFFWSYLATKAPVLKVYTPQVTGFSGFGVLTFVGIYLAARLCHYCDLEHRLSFRTVCVVALVSGGACWIGFMHYHSPFALIFAGSLFYLFKKTPSVLCSPNIFARVIVFVAPSTFSIYLIHNTPLGLEWMQKIEDCWIGAQGMNYYCVCTFVALVFFFGGFLLDLPRRFVKSCLKRNG